MLPCSNPQLLDLLLGGWSLRRSCWEARLQRRCGKASHVRRRVAAVLCGAATVRACRGAGRCAEPRESGQEAEEQLQHLLSCHPDDILGDGSVMKSIIEEGEEPAVYPIFGDECITHFVGSLPDGSVFNDTMKRDQPFKFTLGAEHVLEGFDEGVATMRQGERALLKLAPDVAYGTMGARDEKGWQVPPNTPVTFDVRLLEVLKPGAEAFGRSDHGAGGSEATYRWERRGAEVLVTLPVPEDVQSKDISHIFRETKMSLSVRGEMMLEGVPGCDLEPEECYWELAQNADGKSVLIHLQKKGSVTARWPQSLFKEG